jgi:superfamily II DNA or RNA helicase
MSILRKYQRQAVAAFWEALSPEVNRVAIEMATGLGKTITFGAMVDEWLITGGPPGQESMATHGDRVLVLVHTDELVDQSVETLEFVTRGRWTVGVVKAFRNEVTADIIVASVQTLAQPGRKEQITDVGLIVVDECHHAVAKSYQDILFYYGAMGEDGRNEPCSLHTGWATSRGAWIECSPGCLGNQGGARVPVLGVTATLARTDGQGLGRVFQEMPFSRNLPWAIRQGWLIDLVPYTIKIPGLDPGASDSALDATLADSIAPEAVVKAWASHARGMCAECQEAADQTSDDVGYAVLPSYCPDNCGTMTPGPSTVLFAPLVKSAQAFADAFNQAGVKAEVIHGAMLKSERRAVLDRYRTGVTTVLCNAMVLTEGWNSPRTMCVIVARPTQSVPLFVQMVGRGLRPWLDAEAPPREDQRCILMCVQGTTTELATVADLSENIGEVRDGQSFLAMEDEFDLGKDIPDEDRAYRGPVRVERWDLAVQRSSKAWKYTEAGAPYLPIAKHGRGYVFLVEQGEAWDVWVMHAVAGARVRYARLATAPDLELAMALAEDEAQERGGDIGALLADKNRAWRKGRPTESAELQGRRLLGDAVVDRVLASKAGGKAGKLSDLMDKVSASRVLDGNVVKIRERGQGK